MKMSGGPASLNIKIGLIIIALLIAVGTLYYTQNLVKVLQDRERSIVELYAKGIEYVANTSEPDADITFLFDNILKPIDFPLISTGPDGQVKIENIHDVKDVRNISYDTTLTKDQLEKFFNQKVREMDNSHKPIMVTYEDTLVLQKIHYGDSQLIDRLRLYPYFQIIIAILFIVIGYVGFSSIKRSEQSNIWVGMAKETAHQFGTPISSLMGWLEMLKISYKEPDKVIDIADEIGSDVEKLNKITYRFSKIGSTPEIKPKNVYTEVKKITDYFQRRLPNGKSVDLKIEGDKDLCAEMNPELFGWVIENLIKNSLDAIDHKNGEISITISGGKKLMEVSVHDNGKGIEYKRRKDVFRPGYSTKRRGWGLGLSLSKRIIEGYHGGKIFVKNSSPEGTTISILLNKC
ncbi:MAG TPA: HAMP domain-containing sensor histidine kinase [Ignavibacteriaceae bacterium]|nr:HAMP domain-containing sensor histidine kinase [Ignavibacteriaceae bacterium]